MSPEETALYHYLDSLQSQLTDCQNELKLLRASRTQQGHDLSTLKIQAANAVQGVRQSLESWGQRLGAAEQSVKSTQIEMEGLAAQIAQNRLDLRVLNARLMLLGAIALSLLPVFQLIQWIAAQ